MKAEVDNSNGQYQEFKIQRDDGTVVFRVDEVRYSISRGREFIYRGELQAKIEKSDTGEYLLVKTDSENFQFHDEEIVEKARRVMSRYHLFL